MAVPFFHDGATNAPPNDTVQERPYEMNGTTTTNVHGRSVQLAVMARPSASIAEAVAEARRRHDTPGAWISRPVAGTALRLQVAAS